MGLSFIKKPVGTATAPPDVAANMAAKAANDAAAPAASPQGSIAKIKPSAASWMRTGKEAKAALQNEELKAEERKAEAGKLWRFYVTPGEDAQITFLDGNLDSEGMLEIPVWWEHTVRLNGEYENYACTASTDQSQPCPLCEMGDKADFVGVMTVIDHTKHLIKNGPNKGKTIQNTRKLFVCKRNTIKLLQKYATKRGGLAGCTFDVSRPDEKNARVGEAFDFVHKFASLAEIAEKYALKIEDVQPGVYGDELTYRTPEQLTALGVAKAQLNNKSYKSGASKTSFKDDL